MSGHAFTFEASHIVWSTKDRKPLLDPADFDRLWAYSGGIIRSLRCELLAAGGMPDHVHMLVRKHPSVSTADLLRIVKSKTSAWAKDELSVSRHFAWQRGYGAFSISEDRVRGVRSYINNQAKHHKKLTFQEEYLGFLERHKVKYDPRYIWD
jgi:REP element-mobilizing transposase RayT